MKDLSIKNIFITNVTFLDFLNSVKNIYFSKLFILFPDPWPKKRHKKRRLINEEFTDYISQILVKNGKVIIITDHIDYQKNIHISFESNPRFKLVKSLKQKKLFFENIFETKYYKKAISKNTIIHHSLYRLVEKNS
jgi:tRNA (guanine-N7-)-methyltransferase